MKWISIIGIVFVSIFGTLFHFAYDLIPIFIFPMNESIFEHTKLIIVPMLLYFCLVLLFRIEDKKKIFSSFVTAILSGILIIVSGYYTYSGILGYDVDWINIIIFFISVISSFIIIYKKKTLFDFTNSVVVLGILLILMTLFSYYPLDIAFFIMTN